MDKNFKHIHRVVNFPASKEFAQSLPLCYLDSNLKTHSYNPYHGYLPHVKPLPLKYLQIQVTEAAAEAENGQPAEK